MKDLITPNKIPFFCKNGVHAYKIFSEEQCIQVCYYEFTTKSILVAASSLATISPVEEIEEAEFIKIFLNVSQGLLKNIL